MVSTTITDGVRQGGQGHEIPQGSCGANRAQEQPHLVSSFDEGVDFVVRHGLPPFRFEHLSLAFEGSEQPLFAAGLLVSFHCDAVKYRRADPQGTPETLMVCIPRWMRILTESSWHSRPD